MDIMTRYEMLIIPVSYTHLRAHETVLDIVCRLLLEKKNNNKLIRALAYHIDKSYTNIYI